MIHYGYLSQMSSKTDQKFGGCFIDSLSIALFFSSILLNQC